MKLFFVALLISSLFIGCSTRGKGVYKVHYDDIDRFYDDETPNNKEYSHYTMRPYTIKGVRYYPTPVNIGDIFYGRASWYGPDFHGKLTSNGEKYNMYSMTAAHKTLPMNTIVEVTNRANGRKVRVRINDRGPFVASRIIDLSKAAARKLDMIKTGTASVKLKVVGFAKKKSTKKSSRKRVVHKKRVTKNRYTYKKPVKKVQRGNYALQIASFSRIDGALAMQERYNGIDGYKTVIKDVEDEYGRIFKVILKGFKSRQEALNYRDKSDFRYAFVIREDEE